MQEKKERKSKRIVIGVALATLLMALLVTCLVLLNLGGRPDVSGDLPNLMPPTSLHFIDEILSQLEWGNIVFNAPKAMQFKETRTIELLLSNSVSEQQLRAELEKVERIESARVRISNQMEARLSGAGFRIEAILPEKQAVGSEDIVKWKWDVTATEVGSHRLHLTLSAILTVSGRDTPFVIRTYDRDINVEITLAQRFSSFFSKHWTWLWAAILVPVGGYVWKKYHKKKPNKELTKKGGGKNCPA